MTTLQELYHTKQGDFFTAHASALGQYGITAYATRRASSIGVPIYPVLVNESLFDSALADAINDALPAIASAYAAYTESGDGRTKVTTYSDVVTETDTDDRVRTTDADQRNGSQTTVDGNAASTAYVAPTTVHYDDGYQDVTTEDATHDVVTIKQHTVTESSGDTDAVAHDKLVVYRQRVYEMLSKCLKYAVSACRS